MMFILHSILGSGSQDLSYSTKRKMSQRQKRTRVHRGTQTEECYFLDPLPQELEEGGEFKELRERLLKAEEVSISWWNLLNQSINQLVIIMN